MSSLANLDREIETAFRHDASKILAVLVRLFGPTNVDLAEDTLQDTFTKATEHWRRSGVPENSTAWLILTAKRSAIDKLRKINLRNKHQQELAPQLRSEWSLKGAVEESFEQSQLGDQELRLLFWVAGTDMSEQLRLPVMLKLLCGFTVEAICRALLQKTETIKKRLYRARSYLSEQDYKLPATDNLDSALSSVHLALYLLFNEGINPRNPDPDNHLDLCIDAIGLCQLLVEEKAYRNADSLALLALMNFHYARLPARSNGDFLNIPLDQQDRSTWHSTYLVRAVNFLSLALNETPAKSQRFLLEALIAHEHCRASTFEETDWQTITQHYDALIQETGSPLMMLNRAVAWAHSGSVDESIQYVCQIGDDSALADNYQVDATLAYLSTLQGDVKVAKAYLEKSNKKGLSSKESDLLERRIETLSSQS